MTCCGSKTSAAQTLARQPKQDLPSRYLWSPGAIALQRINLHIFEQTFKNIDDILHKDAGCTSELDYTEQSSWLLFLEYRDALEANKQWAGRLNTRRTYRFGKSLRWCVSAR